MREMSASEVARNFSTVLSAAEHGETIVVTRTGARVAMIVPAPRANGAALREVFGRWHGHSALDDAFAEQARAAVDGVSSELDEDPWRG